MVCFGILPINNLDTPKTNRSFNFIYELLKRWRLFNIEILNLLKFPIYAEKIF